MLIALGVLAMATDTPTLAIVLGFAGTMVTAVMGGFTAVYLNKNERKQAAETTLEKALRERITLRDEELAEVRGDNEQLASELRKVTEQRDRLYIAILEQRAEERAKNDDA